MSTENSRFRPAARTRAINPFKVMHVLERAQELERAGRHIIHLEVGEPDFSSAAQITEAGRAALAAGKTRYTAAAGLPALRDRIAAHYQDAYGVTVDPARIFITPGASGALVLLSQMLLNPGDGVLMTDPGYPCNRNYVQLAGAQAQLVPVSGASGFQVSAEMLDLHHTPASRGVWLASPGNPTGAVMGLSQLRAISDWARRHDCHLLVDEIYHGLDYIGGLPTALQADMDNLVINSFSKYFGMTGWRLGWLVVPDCLVDAANRLAQNLFIAAPTVAQHAALRAFDPDVAPVLQQRHHEFRQRRDYLCAALQTLGFDITEAPAGAFYLYAGISRFSHDSEQFCHELLEQQGVAVTPGTDFGNFQAQTHVRFAFTTSMENLQIAVERIGEFTTRRAASVQILPSLST